MKEQLWNLLTTTSVVILLAGACLQLLSFIPTDPKALLLSPGTVSLAYTGLVFAGAGLLMASLTWGVLLAGFLCSVVKTLLRVQCMTVLLGLLLLGPVTAQAQSVGDQLTDALQGFFGGGGEIPVRDGVTRAETTITAVKTTAMLIDMLIQALTGGGESNNTVPPLLAEQSQVAADGFALMYASEIEGKWSDAFANDHVYPHGGWLLNKVDRDARSLKSQKRLMRTLQLREERFGIDLAAIDDADAAVFGAEGRNAIMQGLGGQNSQANKQQLVTQSLIMSMANMIAVDAAHRINDQAARETQERWFASNGDSPVQPVNWNNPGIY